jgi:hypothetical protein
MAASTSKPEQHPLALQISPGDMPEQEFEALCEDIKRNGQRLEITMFEGKVLDGWQRTRACMKLGMTPKTREYKGDDPVGLIIALNVLRRRLGATQRALAGARLNLDYSITQDEASKRVGVSKVHVNLVVQALKSNNARIIKLLEHPDLTREQLTDELRDAGIIKATQTDAVVAMNSKAPSSTISAAAAAAGLPAGFFGKGGGSDDDDLLGDSESSFDNELDDVLGDPPSANGSVLKPPSRAGVETTEGGMPVVGSRASHPERRTRDTPAYMLAEKFKSMPEGDRISFIQIAWPHLRPLLKAAGVSIDPPAGSAAAVAAEAIDKIAKDSKAPAAAPEAPAKPARKSKAKAD